MRFITPTLDWKKLRILIKMRAITISESARPRLTSGARLQTDSVTSKSVLLYPEGIIELNETAHEIVSRCDGRSVAEIIRALAKEYDAGVAALASDVRETLADLYQRNLIELI
jgi:pyrroloquinoline quinone biosynthesis protein D